MSQQPLGAGRFGGGRGTTTNAFTFNSAPTGSQPTRNPSAGLPNPSAPTPASAYLATRAQQSNAFAFNPSAPLPSPAAGQTASNALPPPSTGLQPNGPSFANPAPNLDSSEFPALGGGHAGSASAATSTPGLFSSYASQAGTNLPPVSALGPLPPATATGLGGPPRDFNSDSDFPALAPGPNDPTAVNPLHGMLNGTSARQQHAHQQEQQSAAAALAHRQGLLGSLGMTSGVARNGNGPLAVAAADEQKRQAQHLKLGGAANNALPPPAVSPPPPLSSAGSTVSFGGQQQQATFGQVGQHAPAPQHQQPNGPPVLANGISPAPGSNAPRRRQTPSNGDQAGVTVQPPPHVLQQMQLQLQQHQQPPALPLEMPQSPVEQVMVSPADRFGLLGLLHLIKHANAGQSLLSLGSDLSKLGLELGRTGPLSADFATPWAEGDATVEPEFTLPACYNVQPPPAAHKIPNFTDETLFFIFYSQPRDYMQELAAQELYKHNWRYHKELKLWLTKESGVEPTQKTATYERGSYIFFDPLEWHKSKREFVLVYSDLESRPNAHLPPAPPQHSQPAPSGTAANLPLA